MTRCCKLCVMSHSGVCSIVKTSASLVDDILQLPIPSPLKEHHVTTDRTAVELVPRNKHLPLIM
ncbi:hypothetical protein C5167_025450 [Papaver somniferum]|uniref:Uncharacterized protein n=1 Tax=Papaver somniferum TaxID=3469 RepID=A0A4Y7JUQ7_PAPSO|nr:hypothetical protein C5167_025450 [Papaver somniferum]